jgi:hypothetical protein
VKTLHVNGGQSKTWCGLEIRPAINVLPPNQAQHCTCKRCKRAIAAWAGVR